MKRFLILFFLCACAGPALATLPDERLKDPVLEARAQDLTRELRCMVCQNQSIEESDAPLARDLRILVRERVAAGESDEAVRKYLVARYGEFVLLRPPLNAETALLWFAPLLVLVLSLGFALRRYLRKASGSR